MNAQEIRSRLEAQGSIFQTNSDTEVIVHLIALSKEQTLPEAMADALRRVEGAFSLVMISRDRIFAARDPRGFRPLAMGHIPPQSGEKRDTIVFASETCAFDLIGARYERDVKPGELVVVGPEGISSRFYSPQGRNRAASSSTFISRAPTAWCSAGRCMRVASTSGGNWPRSLRPMRTSWSLCRTPA